MPLLYCSLHQRLFAQHQQAWVDFSLEKRQQITGLTALLRATKAESPDLTFLETACDRCEDAIIQVLRIQRTKLDPPP
jgi:hypothetical protein